MKSRSLIAVMICCVTVQPGCVQSAQPAAARQGARARRAAGTRRRKPPPPPAEEKKTIAFCVADAVDQWLSYLYDERTTLPRKTRTNSTSYSAMRATI
jgi:hypothetical protein